MRRTRSPHTNKGLHWVKGIQLTLALVACLLAGVGAASAQDSPLGTSKDVVSLVPASSGIPGNFDVEYRITMAATGDKSLTLLSMTDDMTQQDQLGSAFVKVLEPGVTVLNVNSTRPPLPSQSYDGTNKLLASSENDLVEPGQSFEIRVTVEVNPDAPGAPEVLRNQGFASAFNTEGGFERDITDSGSNPGGTNPGEPGDTGGSDDPTPLDFGAIGLAKEVVSVEVSDTLGNFDVTYRFVTENTGDFDLNNLSLVDDMTAPDQLGTAFVSVTVPPSVVNVSASVPPAANPSYNGTGDLLIGSPSDLLEPGQVFEVFVTVELDADAPGAPTSLDNQGLVSGTSPAGNTVKDLSDTGSDPDGTNPGEPGDTGGSDDPTPVALPSIGVSKKAERVRAPGSGVDGNWEIGYFITVRNTGSTTLSNLSLIDDMTDPDRIGSAFVGVVLTPRVRNINATDPPAPNPNFDGSGDLIVGSPTDVLEPGQSYQVGVIIEVDPDAPGANDPLLNQAVATGTDENGVEVKDSSDSGSDPSGTNPGEPGDTGGSDDPTPSRFPDIGLSKFVSDSRPNGANTDIEYTLVVENTGNTSLSELILLDNMTTDDRLGSAFVGISVAPVVNNVNASSPPLPNLSYNGTGDMLNGSAADQLDPGQRFEVIVVVEINPAAPGAPNPLLNQAIVGGTDGQGLDVSDPSDSGSDPDGTNPGEPGDTGGSDDPTPIQLPQIGLAKEVESVVPSSTDGNFDVTYSFIVGNTGTTDLSNLSLVDDMSDPDQLGSSFVAVAGAPQVVNISASNAPAPNAGYNGTGDLLNGAPSDLLEPGQRFQVLVVIEVNSDAPGAPAELFNQGLAQGTDDSGITVEDLSDTGSDPNGDNPGEPGDLGTSDDPTPLSLPDIGLAKSVTRVSDAATPGNFEVGYTFVVENTGNTTLSSLSLVDDMTAADQLGSAFVSVIRAPEVDNVDATSPPAPNGGYDGTNDLLNGSGADRLDPGQRFEVTVIIEVNPNAPGAPEALVNQGEVSGTDTNGVEVSDPSDTGTDPDGTNPGEPGDSGGSDDPTPISFPDISLAKFVSDTRPNGANTDIEFTLVVQNTGTTTLSELVLLDNMTTADRLGSAFVGVSEAPVVNNIDATSAPEANPAYDGTGDMLNGSAADQLEAGQSFEVVVVVEINPAAPGAPNPLVNQAFVEGTDPQGLEVDDLSDSGADPTGTNPGEPGDTGGSDDPTPIELPQIGLAKEVVLVEANGSGTFDVTYSFVVGNTGTTDLSDLELVDDMSAADQLGTAFVAVATAPSVVNIDATTPPAANPGYNGTGDLLNGSPSDLLEPGQSFQVLVTIEVDSSAPGAPADLFNQAVTRGTDPSDITVEDLSDTGSDPTGTNPGEPGDQGTSDDPTPLSLPAIGLAKVVTRVNDAATPGNFEVGYTFVVENTGTTTLSELSLLDDMTAADQLGSAFVSVVRAPEVDNIDANVPPAPNAGYNGTNDLLSGSTADRLAPGQMFEVTVIIEINPNAPGAPVELVNQGVVFGTDPNDVVVSDPSDTGTDPDGTNPGEPGDTGGSDDPTPIGFPDIGLAKFASAVTPNGANIDIEFTLVVENTGGTTLSELVLLDNMTTPDRLGSAFVGVTSAPVVLNIDASSPPAANPAYDGTGDMLLGSVADMLEPGQSFTVVVVVEADPNAPGAPNPLVNQAFVEGTDPQGLEVDDLSDSGADPNGDNPGQPGDTGGSDDPTPIPLSNIGVAKSVSEIVANGENFDVTYSIIVENTGGTDLTELTLVDDMTPDDRLGSAFIGVTEAPVVVNIDATSPPAANPSYDGTNDLIDGSSSDLLEPGQMYEVLVTVEMDPDAVGAPDVLLNQATATGEDSNGVIVTDDSDTGNDPGGSNPGEPGDTGGMDDPTPVAFPDLVAEKTDELAIDADGDGVVSPGDTLHYTVVVRNIGDGDAENVTFEDTPDGNTALVVGSVTSSPFGEVLVGNDPGDTMVTVAVGTVGAGDSVTIEFDVVLDDPLTAPSGPGRILLSEQLDPTVLYDVDVATQEATFVLDFVTDDRVHAIGLCSDADLLYGVGKLSGEVVEVDLFQKPAVERSIGLLPAEFLDAVVQLTCGDDDQLYFTNALTNELVTLDVATCPSCDPVVIGVIETADGLADVAVDGADLAFLPDGTLYLLTNANGGELYSLNLGNARATFIGAVDTPEGNHGLAGTGENRLIIASNDDRLYEIDPATAEVTDLGTVTLDGVDLDLGFGDAAAAPPRVTSIANQGVVNSDLLGPIVTDDPDTPEEGDATVTLIGNCPELIVVQTDELLKDADGSGDVTVGDVLRFTTTIVSNGNQPEENVVFVNRPGRDLELVVGSVRSDRGEVLRGQDDGDELVDVSLGFMEPGETAEVSFSVVVASADRRQRVTNQSFVGSDHAPNGVASDDPRTPVKGDPTVVVLKDRPLLDAWNRDRLVIDADGDGMVSPGDVVRYSVTVANFGGESVQDIRIANRPGKGTELVPGSVVTTGGDVELGNTEGDGKVWVTIPSLAGANSVTFSFDLRVEEGVSRLSNQAEVRAAKQGRLVSDDPATRELDDATDTAGQ